MTFLRKNVSDLQRKQCGTWVVIYNLSSLLKLRVCWNKPNRMADLWVRAEGHLPCPPPLPLIRAAGPRLVSDVCCWKQNNVKQTEGGVLICHHCYKHNNHWHTREIRVTNICLMLSKRVQVKTNINNFKPAFFSLRFKVHSFFFIVFENTSILYFHVISGISLSFENLVFTHHEITLDEVTNFYKINLSCYNVKLVYLQWIKLCGQWINAQNCSSPKIYRAF